VCVYVRVCILGHPRRDDVSTTGGRMVMRSSGAFPYGKLVARHLGPFLFVATPYCSVHRAASYWTLPTDGRTDVSGGRATA